MNISNKKKKVRKVNRLIKKPENIVDELYGSLKSSVPFADMETVRKIAGIALGKKYLINLKKNAETFDKNLQKLQKNKISTFS